MKAYIITIFSTCILLCSPTIYAQNISSNLSPALEQRIDAYIAGDEDKAEKFIEKLKIVRLYYPEYRQFLTQIIDYLEFVPDDHIHKYVGPGHTYTNPLYKPNDLKPLTPSTALSIRTDLRESESQIRSSVHAPLLELAQAYHYRFGTSLHINSARRSYHEQQNRFKQSCFDAGICAQPGTSEHQNGMTIDIANMRGDTYTWMQHNAHTYGFHQSFQKGPAIDGFKREPRHRRYIGKELATQLYEDNMSFTQWHALQ